VLQALTMLVGVGIVVAVAVMAWQAHEDHALVIEPFSTPPVYAQQGLTGQALASELMDHLSAVTGTAKGVSLASVSGVQADRQDQVKVEIPETGVSLGEIDQMLRNWLGRQTKVDGELRQTADGQLLLIVRVDGRALTARGPADELDQMEQQTAEQVFATVDPSNYGIYLGQTNRRVQALAVIRTVAEADPSYLSLWAQAERSFDPLRSLQLARLAFRRHPDWGSDYSVTAAELAFGHDEAALADARRLLTDVGSGPDLNKLSGAGARDLRIVGGRAVAALQGAYASAPPALSGSALGADFWTGPQMAALAHDLGRARDLLDRAVASGAAEDAKLSHTRGVLDTEAGDRAAAASEFRTAMDRDRAAHASDPFPEGIAAFAEVATISNGPPLAEALAQLGDYAGAEAAIAPTPLDCYPCLRERGRVAAMQGHWPEADRWFAEAVRQGPSLPFADTDWGGMLLRKGDATGAIAKLEQAHKLGPRYADPLELWGEALMAKRDYAGAITKFTEADKDAPKWGRNHLRWGEALMLSGRYAEARAQYVTANGLDLSVGDRAAVNVLLARTATGPLHG
jgi:tetratricopeptide (TPR) repeat protein